MKNIKQSLIAGAVTAALALSANTAFAGNNDGGLSGKVLDAVTSNVISGATVTIRNTKTGFTKTLTSDADGSFRLSGLPVGVYSVTSNYNGYGEVSLGTVNVGIGGDTNVNITMVSSDNTEVIEVRGSAIATIDVTSSESALNISSVELERIPVPRDVTSVALLAPGTTRGDSRFGSSASFGGASVAENQMYINGLNVTNFRNGLGFSNVPYEFYDQFQVKTGGYSAEFGRSTGGVINAVTKSGSNDFEFGASIFVQPEGLRETSPSVRANDGTWLSYRDNDTRSSTQANIWASGAIIEDTLFYYVIYNPKNIDSEFDRFESNGDLSKYEQDDAFWGAKIDWNITEDHRLEFLAFSDDNTQAINTYRNNNGNAEYASTTNDLSGGDNWSIKYTGYLTEDLSMTVLYGENEYNRTSLSNTADSCELVMDRRFYFGADGDQPVPDRYLTGCSTFDDYFVEVGDDTREAFRVDFEWVLDDHIIRFGMDNETNTSFSEQRYSGPNGAYWFIYPGSDFGYDDRDVVRDRVRTVGGSFETEAGAFYIEDTWTISETLTANIGLRREMFDNKNGEGETFAKMDDMIAPRLGLTWDVNGDGESKAFFNVGRYFLPVASNTNVRLAGNEADSRRYYFLEGYTEVDGIYQMTLSEPWRTDVISDGSVPDTRSIVSKNLDAMYQDEIIIGYEAMLNDDWSYGVKYTNREMNGAIDDMIIDHAYDCGADYHPHQYVLGNPGKDMEVYGDTNCDGEADGWMTFSAEDLVYAEAIRKYHAVDLNVKKQWDGVWSLSATYTWSHSYGNAEGMVKSDNGQDDAGLTTDWDFPELMDGAYGNLPNDRRHMFKVYGTYAITEDLTAGFNFNLESGRPLNAFGLGHPNVGELDYGEGYYLTTCDDPSDTSTCEYTKTNRGSMGRLPWQARLDLNMMYNTEIMGADAMFKIDVFNVLNADTYTRVEETAEENFGVINSRTFGRPLAFQTPRYVQLSARFAF
ncbi:TonB-dependent receptor [Thalassotalea sp. G2M2-11]|uniref:TonB-dependent receptor n=1 Tax=Thalassotalea sp. G2M2-11 TaxID=2787627 RepID=UPI0019D27C9A|nr:TonB-dependent receptor [Thalassotalea sp. G2M2-11]